MRIEILKMMDEYKKRMNKSPQYLYVGMDTWVKMHDEFTASDVYLSSIVKGARPQCYGLLVHIVDAEEHLNVG
jgi:hypothetical protein